MRTRRREPECEPTWRRNPTTRASKPHSRCVILAGSESGQPGRRTRAIPGHKVPKPYRAILRRDTLLRMTLRRATLATDPARIQTIVTRARERHLLPPAAE